MIKITNFKKIEDGDQIELIPFNVNTKYKTMVTNNIVTLTNDNGDKIVIDFTSNTIQIIE